MKLSIDTMPNRIIEAKKYLDYIYNDKDQNNHVYINVDKVSAYYDKAQQLMKQMTDDMQQLLFEETGQWVNFKPSSPKDMIVIFTEYLKIPESEITRRGKLSLSKEVIANLGSKYKTPFISAFVQFKEYQTISSGLVAYYKGVTAIPNAYNNEGDRIGKIRTAYNLNETYRMSTYDPHIQGLNLNVADIVTAPEGWVIVKVDSGQIEPRIYYSTIVRDPLIFWLIEQYDDVYFALADYCLRDNTEYTPDNLYLFEGLDKNHRSTLKTLVNAGNYGSSIGGLRALSSSMYEDEYYKTEEGMEKFKEIRKIGYYERNKDNENIPEKYRKEFVPKLEKARKEAELVRQKGHELADKFFSRLIQHPHRVQYEREVQERINRGDRTIVSPFGDSRDVFGSIDYIKRCYLNNPLQMAVARLSAISVCKAFEFINENEKLKKFVRYAYMKHDEDVYYVRKEVAEEVAKELTKFRQYEVEGWIPIKSDYTITLDYTK